MAESMVRRPTSRGYRDPCNHQFSVFLDNRVGKLGDLVTLCEKASVRIVALSVVDSRDHAVVRLVSTQSERVRTILREHRLPHGESDVLIVSLTPTQCLSSLCQCLLAAELNIDYAYPLMVRPHGESAMVLHTDDETLAARILRDKRFRLLDESDLVNAAA